MTYMLAKFNFANILSLTIVTDVVLYVVYLFYKTNNGVIISTFINVLINILFLIIIEQMSFHKFYINHLLQLSTNDVL